MRESEAEADQDYGGRMELQEAPLEPAAGEKGRGLTGDKCGAPRMPGRRAWRDCKESKAKKAKQSKERKNSLQ